MKVTDLRERERDIKSEIFRALKDSSIDHLRWNNRRQKGITVREGTLRYDHQGGGQDHTLQSLVSCNITTKDCNIESYAAHIHYIHT